MAYIKHPRALFIGYITYKKHKLNTSYTYIIGVIKDADISKTPSPKKNKNNLELILFVKTLMVSLRIICDYF